MVRYIKINIFYVYLYILNVLIVYTQIVSNFSLINLRITKYITYL